MSDQGLSLQERINQMRKELDALQQIQTQEDFDEGARLHAEKNAPWVKGQYTHIKFPPYVFKEFPKMLYGVDYPEAVRLREEADLIPAWGTDDADRKKAVLEADRRIQNATVIVKSERELRALGAGWFETPGDVVEHKRKVQRELELQAAHRAHDDRRMRGKAAEERDRIDEEALDFVAEIPAPKKQPRRRVLTRVTR